MYKMSLLWPPTEQDFKLLMKQALEMADKKDVTALVYCDNPEVMIFDPLEHIIQCETQIGQARCGERTVRIIIGKED